MAISPLQLSPNQMGAKPSVQVTAFSSKLCDSTPSDQDRFIATAKPLAPITSANATLLTMKEDIPGTARVDKYMTQGAEKLGIHIRQMHTGLGMTEEEKKKLKSVQEDMAKILGHFYKQGHRKLIIEGLSTGNEKPLNEILELHRKARIKRVNSELKKHGIKKIKNMDDWLSRSSAEQRMFRAFAASEPTPFELYDVEKSGLLEIFLKYPFELQAVAPYSAIKEQTQAFIDLFYSFNALEYDKAQKLIFDDRENNVLAQVAANEEELTLVLFGAAHQFAEHEERHAWTKEELEAWGGELKQTNNIAEWNKTHADDPSKQINWVELTPESL